MRARDAISFRACLILAALAIARPAAAHVGSPDVFFEGDAGPYHLDVTVRTPEVIPGVAQVEVRTDADVTDVTVVPMRLTGPGSTLPPAPDRATRSEADPRFFTASLWLMERGSLQVRITADGARGRGALAVPVAASARATRTMGRGLGALLFGLMLVLALSLVAIAAGAAREVGLEPGAAPEPRARRRTRLAAIAAAAVVAIVVVLGNWWWDAEARTSARWVEQPWHPAIAVANDGCRLSIAPIDARLMRDHGHLVHLFLVRDDLTALAHLHPQQQGDGSFQQALPPLPAGHYHAFADVVLDGGYPITGTAEVPLAGAPCPHPTGDDAMWTGHGSPDRAWLPDSGNATMIWDRPAALHAGVATSLRFRVVDAAGAPVALEPYMGMAAHAAIVATDGTVFAHIHPSGTVAMPALALAQGMGDMPMPDAPVPSTISFPYGFPRAGAYRVFVQVRLAGGVVTGAFDVTVPP